MTISQKKLFEGIKKSIIERYSSAHEVRIIR